MIKNKGLKVVGVILLMSGALLWNYLTQQGIHSIFGLPSYIQGPSDARLLDVVQEDYFYQGVWGFEPLKISNDSINPVILNRLGIDFQVNATVGEVNALLRRVDATIISTVVGANVYNVRIPARSSVSDLQILINQIKQSPFVYQVHFDYPLPPVSL